MKKLFEQPELMVVQMNNLDIVTESLIIDTDADHKVTEQFSAGRGREDWDAGY